MADTLTTQNTEGAVPQGRKILWTAAELLDHEFPPIVWIVPDLITSGLTLLVGAPKLGKSWLSLAIGYAVSVGGAVLSKIRVPEYDVLYLALEDTPRRLQSRLEKIGATRSERLHVALEWKPGADGIDWLHRWMEKAPDTKLVIVDTWGRWAASRDGNDYAEVTAQAAALKSVADQYDISILAVHHTRKAEVSDYLEATLGSTGLAAAADSTLVLRRGRGNRAATLSVTGRDIEEAEYVLHFDSTTGTWALQGTTAEVQESDARQKIFDLLRESGPMGPKDIANALEKNHSTIKTLVRRMSEDDVIVSHGGLYTVSDPHRPIDRVDRRPQQTTGTTGSIRVYESTGSTVYENMGESLLSQSKTEINTQGAPKDSHRLTRLTHIDDGDIPEAFK